MGIKNVNIGVCDTCGKTYTSEKKQTELLKYLRGAGWKGSMTSLECPECARKTHSREGGYFGTLNSIEKMGDDYYAKVISKTKRGPLSVYIPYDQIASAVDTDDGTETDFEAVIASMEKKEVEYRISSKKSIEENNYFIADFLGTRDAKSESNARKSYADAKSGDTVYYGTVRRLIYLDEDCFVLVSSYTRNKKIDVYIPYEQLTWNPENPSIETLKKTMTQKKVPYRISRILTFKGRRYFIADFLGRKEKI